MPLSDILEAFERFELGDGDEVILNGGEPTTYDALAEVVSAANRRGARVVLFTNGRRICNPAYATPLLTAGVHRLSIPLHGRWPATHDCLTRRPGSWQQTVDGIAFAQKIRSATAYPREIELKVLAIKSSLPEWPAIVDWLATQHLEPFTFVMSGLHMWSTATTAYEDVVPTMHDLTLLANEAIRRAQSHGFRIVLWAIPLCLIDSDLLGRLWTSCDFAMGNAQATECQTVYFDASCRQGVEVSASEVVHPEQLPHRCITCDLAARCGPGRAFLHLLESQVMPVNSAAASCSAARA